MANIAGHNIIATATPPAGDPIAVGWHWATPSGTFFVCTSVSPITWAEVGGAGGMVWGDITGTLANQTDLQTALTARELTANKNAANGYPGLSAGSKITGSQQTYGSGANTACEGNDARLSDARTPTVHAISHKSGGSDVLLLDELGASTDVTTLNASTSAHGLMQKYPGGTTNFLRADGIFAVPPGGAGTAKESFIPFVTLSTEVTF